MPKNQKGFGHAETFLFIIIILMISGIGWYVWKSGQNANKSLDNTTQNLDNLAQQNTDNAEGKQIPKPTTEAVGDKIKFTHSSLGFSFKYPKQWGDVEDTSSYAPGEEHPNYSYSFSNFEGVVLRIPPKIHCPQGDGPGLSSSQGWFQENGKYYLNWCKDSPDDSGQRIEYGGEGYDEDFVIRKINNSVLLGYDFTTYGVSDEPYGDAEGLFNLSDNPNYTGLVLYHIWTDDDNIDAQGAVTELEEVMTTFKEL